MKLFSVLGRTIHFTACPNTKVGGFCHPQRQTDHSVTAQVPGASRGPHERLPSWTSLNPTSYRKGQGEEQRADMGFGWCVHGGHSLYGWGQCTHSVCMASPQVRGFCDED